MCIISSCLRPKLNIQIVKKSCYAYLLYDDDVVCCFWLNNDVYYHNDNCLAVAKDETKNIITTTILPK